VPVGERYVYANHPLVNLERDADADESERRSNTHARHERAGELLRDSTDAGQVEAALADRHAPISCARQDGWMTYGGTSISFGDGPPIVRIALGPPHETAWQTVGWA